MKKILITGNSGYIGSHLTNILKEDDSFELYGLDKTVPQIKVENFSIQDITERNTWMYETKDLIFDAVIHLAAEVSVNQSVKNPTLYYNVNTNGTINLLEKIKTKNFIFASTGAAVGLGSPYAISKRMAEDIVKEICDKFKIPFTIFRFYNVIGSDGISPTNPDGLFYKLIEAMTSKEFNLYGNDYSTRDGSCERDYVHVNEICHALIEAIDVSSNKIENLGHGKGYTVKEIIEIFKKSNNCDFHVNFCDRRAGDLEKSVLDNPSSYMKSLYSIDNILKITN